MKNTDLHFKILLPKCKIKTKKYILENSHTCLLCLYLVQIKAKQLYTDFGLHY